MEPGTYTLQCLVLFDTTEVYGPPSPGGPAHIEQFGALLRGVTPNRPLFTLGRDTLAQ